jgi:hypothetical protein
MTRITRRRVALGAWAATLLSGRADARSLLRGKGGGFGSGGGGGPTEGIHGTPLLDPISRPTQEFIMGSSGTASVVPLTGTVTIDGDFIQSEPPPTLNSMTVQYMVDGVPIDHTGQPGSVGPYLLGPVALGRVKPNFPWTVNSSSQLTNGTHHIVLRFVDTTSGAGTSAYRASSYPGIFLVQNPVGTGVSSYTGPQQVPTGVAMTLAYAGQDSNRPDFVTYPGTVPQVNAYPRPVVNVPPTNDIKYRNITNCYIEDTTANKSAQEFIQTPGWATTLQGGVYIDYHIADIGKNTVEQAYPTVFRAPTRPGGRCAGLSTPFSTWIAIAGDDTGYYGVYLQGGLYHLAWDGTQTLLAGLAWDPTKLAFDPYYAALYVDEPTTLAQMQKVGTNPTIDDDDLSGLNDLCDDPRDAGHKTFYLANYIYSYILKVDLNFVPPHITIHAGQPDVQGYVNGSAASALFHSPASIVCCDGTVSGFPAGTLLIADFVNSCIRRVSPAGVVDTLCGNQTSKPTDAQLGNPGISDTWSPAAAASFTPGNDTVGAYVNRPFVLRFTSDKSKLVIMEMFTSTLRVLDLVANTITRIPGSKAAVWPSNYDGWAWIDVDTVGAFGPQNDIACVNSFGGARPIIGESPYSRMSLDGSYFANWIGDAGGYTNEGPGGSGAPFAPIPVYSWAACFAKTRAHFIGGGTRWYGIQAARPAAVGDPVVDVATNTGIDGTLFFKAENGATQLWWHGTCKCFPLHSRPGWASLYGSFGEGFLGSSVPGSVVPSFNDLATTYPTDGSFTAEICAPGTLGRYFQDGGAGVVPRPEMTGNDLRAICYLVRRMSLSGTYPVTASPGPLNTDTTFALISDVIANRINSTSIRVRWTTDKRTIGCACAGSANQSTMDVKYNVFSPIESSFNTSHDCTITGLPIGLVHYSVISKDVAGNSVYANDRTIA